MKLEYIADGAIDTPLIRLYEFGSHEAVALQGFILELSAGLQQQIALHGVPGFDAVAGCQLVLRVGTHDKGILREAGVFVWTLTRESWADVAALVDPFCEDVAGATWQYLDETSAITVVLSTDGGW